MRPRTSEKPPYRVPTMVEIAKTRGANGYDVVSLFAGGGGSSTGYEMAGFRVVWANEFLPHAREVYRANHPETIIDPRDIRTIEPEEILEAIGKKRGELDVLDGSPPCDPFSTAGKGSKDWGKKKSYYGGKARQRTDDLFFEYIRILEGLQPRVFVAENVAGLVKGKAKGYFLQILAALKATGYNVEARILDAKWMGVPQSRPRVMFIGSGGMPVWPVPFREMYVLADAIPSALYGSSNNGFGVVKWRKATAFPNATLLSSRDKKYGGWVRDKDGERMLTLEEGKRVGSFPRDYKLGSEPWKIIGMSVAPLMMRAIAEKIQEMLDAER